MYLVKIIDGVAVLLIRSDTPRDNEGFVQISEEQFNNCTLPCRTEVTEDGVVFGDIVGFDRVPVSEACELTPEPTQPPSQLDIIEAQVTYTAMMTDTLLEV